LYDHTTAWNNVVNKIKVIVNILMVNSSSTRYSSNRRLAAIHTFAGN